MDAATVLTEVREVRGTELDRLGSDKALLAATDARLESDPILETVAHVLAYGRDAVAEWAEEAGGGAATEVLERTAGTLGDAHDRVAAERDDPAPAPDGDAPFLRLEAESDVDRVAAATIATPLVLDRLFLQSVSFYVNEADTARADLFRELREQMNDLLAAGQEALDALCSDDEWEHARAAATATVEAAYEDYVDRLDALGFDPKPIC